MGGTTSTEEGAAKGPAATPDDADYEAYDRVFRGEVDAKSNFREAFANDAKMLGELEALVKELEGQRGDSKATAAEMKRLETMAKMQEEKEQKKHRTATATATVEADNWFQKQIQQGRAAEEAARAAKDIADEKRRQAAAAEATKLEARALAKAESAARAKLFEDMAEKTTRECLRVYSETSNRHAYMIGDFRASRFAQGFRATEQPGVLAEDDLPPIPCSNEMPLPELYQLLSVKADATFEEIKKGYRKQALLWHPDKNRHRLELATARFQKINDAFDILFDPKRRETYDSGQITLPKKVKKLTGSGWASIPDEDDLALTPEGLKRKKQSWRTYVLIYGRIDDDPKDFVDDDNDPRAPQMKINLFWRFFGELAYDAREQSESDSWMREFMVGMWKDTPERWPKALELQQMTAVSQEEWKERRMVYNRRRQKLQIAIEMHEKYLAIPDREELEKARLQKKMNDAAISSTPKWNMLLDDQIRPKK